MESAQETYNALEELLNNEVAFKEVVKSVFESIDTDHSGSLEKGEITQFIQTICGEMDIKKLPGNDSVEQVFKEIDTDHSNNISQGELGVFLKTIFLEQKKQLAKQLGK